MIYAISYVLAFPTIWSVATGYLSLTTRVYRMSDSSLVSLDTNDLALCWSIINDRRFNSDDEEYLEMGPTLKQIYPQHYGQDIWSDLYLETLPKVKVSDAFKDLYACMY